MILSVTIRDADWLLPTLMHEIMKRKPPANVARG